MQHVTPYLFASMAATYTEKAAGSAAIEPPLLTVEPDDEVITEKAASPADAHARLDRLIDTYHRTTEEMRKTTAAEILALFQAAFTESPLVKALVWSQYTPYFNDGDPCTFSMNVESPCRSTIDPRVKRWNWIAGRAPTDDEIAASAPLPHAVPASTTDDDDDDDDGQSDYFHPYGEYEDPGLKIKSYRYERFRSPNGYRGWDSRCVDVPVDEEAVRQCDAMEAVIDRLPDDLAERVIGDHVKVLVWAGGIATTEHRHD